MKHSKERSVTRVARKRMTVFLASRARSDSIPPALVPPAAPAPLAPSPPALAAPVLPAPLALAPPVPPTLAPPALAAPVPPALAPPAPAAPVPQAPAAQVPPKPLAPAPPASPASLAPAPLAPAPQAPPAPPLELPHQTAHSQSCCGERGSSRRVLVPPAPTAPVPPAPPAPAPPVPAPQAPPALAPPAPQAPPPGLPHRTAHSRSCCGKRGYCRRDRCCCPPPEPPAVASMNPQPLIRSVPPESAPPEPAPPESAPPGPAPPESGPSVSPPPAAPESTTKGYRGGKDSRGGKTGGVFKRNEQRVAVVSSAAPSPTSAGPEVSKKASKGLTKGGAVGDAGMVDTLEARLEDARRCHEANEYGPNLPLAVIEAGIRSVWAEEHPARPASPRPVNNEGGVDVGVNAGGDQVGSNAGGTSRQRGVIHADEVGGVQVRGMRSSAAAGSSQGNIGG
ncbi:unnamed protein product [Closterium sp. NIES-54]